MIDTNKYENITPERWTVDEDDPYRVVDAQECTIARTDFIDIEEERTWQLANAQLIADAPKLLAEIRRLREAFITAVSHLDVESRNEMFNDMDADLQSIWLFRSE
jgi:hypothetical protein